MRNPYGLRKRGRLYYGGFYVTINGQEKRRWISTGCTSKAKASRYLDQLIASGRMAPESSDTFAFYAKDWWLPGKCPYIKEHERNGRILSNNFIRSSRSALLRYILPAFKAKHLCDITTHDIDEWKYALVEKKGLSNKSANCYLSIVKTMFDYWWCHGFIKEDPAKKVKQMYARCRERGEVYYDFDYTKTKKEILQNLSVSTNLVGRPQAESLSTIKDRRLLQLLQGDFSKVLDENGEPLVLCHGIGEEFKKQEGKTLVRQVDEYFEKNYDNKVIRPGLGAVSLNWRGIQSSLAHGIGRNKAVAFHAVPEIIKNGRIFGETTDYKGRGYDAIVIAAPIRIGNEDYICETVVNRNDGKNDFYLHEVEVKRKLQAGDHQVRAYTDEPKRITTGGASRLIIAKLAAEGKFNFSKAVDGNGEPLVLYHGTGEKFDAFRKDKLGPHERAFFFTSNRQSAEEYGATAMPVFLDMKNPVFLDDDYNDAEGKSYDSESDGFWKEHDGYVVDRDEDWNEYVVKEPNQIKSATGNAGTFNPGTDNILFQTIERNYNPKNFKENQESLDKFDKQIEKHDTDKRYKANEYYTAYAHTPLVYRELGYGDLPLVLFKSKVNQVLAMPGKPAGKGTPYGDTIDIGIIRKAVHGLSDPLAIFNSVRRDKDTKTYKAVPGSFVTLVSAVDKKGNPVVVPLHMERKVDRLDVDVIASAYGRMKKDIKAWADNGSLRYIDQEKASASVLM